MDNWHRGYNPRDFLRNVDVEKLIRRNETDSENIINILGSPCVLCGSVIGPGLMLNDKTYLCKDCFKVISETNYPEIYEKQYREYLAESHAYYEAKWKFRAKVKEKIEKVDRFNVLIFFTFMMIVIKIWLIVLPIAIYIVITQYKNKLNALMEDWDAKFKKPIKPELYHFHHPLAILSERDKKIMEVFNNWPGVPPFWDYLKQVVKERDNNHCQVTGCPSRVPLHVHHIIPKSEGGKHIPDNLVTLCCFHHALEPSAGHNFVWSNLKNDFFTMVRSFRRRNPVNPGYHIVKAFVRNRELVRFEDIINISNYYKYSCPECESRDLEYEITEKEVIVNCKRCGNNWIGDRKLAEEVGPNLAELLIVNNNAGKWKPRWDMLEERKKSFLMKTGSCNAKLNSTQDNHQKEEDKRQNRHNETKKLCKKVEEEEKGHQEAAKQNKISTVQRNKIEQYKLGRKYHFGIGVKQDYKVAVKWYKLAAEQGYVSAQFNLGYAYYSGVGVLQDYEKAAKWFRSAAEQGYVQAQHYLGWCCYNGNGVIQDIKEAVKWYKLAAEQGYVSAQFNLGYAYYNGEGVLQDYEKAVKWFRLAAEQGHAKSQNYLGFCYNNGEGVKLDRKEAIKWYKLAAEQGNVSAQYNLGYAYYSGKGVLQDYEEAVKWFRLAAEQGHAKSQNYFGYCYNYGKGIILDRKEAIKWYKLAAEQGDVTAQYNLGFCYENGDGVIQDYKEALKWYKSSAEQGDADAQFSLGNCIYHGFGIIKDNNMAVKWFRLAAEQGQEEAQSKLEQYYKKNRESNDLDQEEAAKWYRSAAEKGDVDAKFNLGVCYEFGRGVNQDYKEAVKWYRSAAEKGHTTAQNILGVCYETGTGVGQNYQEAYKWYLISCSNISGDLFYEASLNKNTVKKYLNKEQIVIAEREVKEIQGRIDGGK
ncbi:MAG: HNH endonuclease [Candidatus Cloacimonetes bacterium]|nr:HNH endonuclease [Candidatus Cloacimonadota bacterium]